MLPVTAGDTYFPLLVCFLMSNMSDLTGRYITHWIQVPNVTDCGSRVHTSCGVGWQPSRVIAGDVCLEMCLHSSLSLVQRTGVKHVLSTVHYLLLTIVVMVIIMRSRTIMTWLHPSISLSVVYHRSKIHSSPPTPMYPPYHSILLVLLFGLSNGYLGSTAMVTAPQ